MSTATNTGGGRPKSQANASAGQLSPEHYLRIIWHRKWLVLFVFILVTAGTVVVAQRMPDVFSSYTLILVDPQKVPESYVKSTVTGDVRNRLGTLSQQILSATRLQKIIDTLNLYPLERKTMAREDIITLMRKDIGVTVMSDFGASQDLQAFRITYSGTDPRQVAQVANELASLFIDENLKAREQQATGTTEFLQNQLGETRKAMEEQESKLRDFKMKHLGEMPEQQQADLQILGQLQSQLQLESDALGRAEQNRSVIQSMMSQTNAPVVDVDENDPRPNNAPRPDGAPAPAPKATTLDAMKARLTVIQERYGDTYPDVRKLKALIADEESKEKLMRGAEAKSTETKPAETREVAAVETKPAVPAPPAPRKTIVPAANSVNPVLQTQLRMMDAEITKHKEEHLRLSKQLATYTARLEAIPVNEQQIADLVRDYEITKGHYKLLLENQLSAETATQLEIRQKGEKFSILDPAQPAEKPTRPNRPVIELGGALSGFALGLLCALVTEFLGMSITAPEQITEASGIPVLEVIPIILTYTDRRNRKRRLIWAAASVILSILAGGAALFYHYRM